MAAERIVACPHCGTTRTTRANQGVALGCSSCGEKFLAPPVDAAGAAVSTSPDPAGGDPVGSGTVKVRRGRLHIAQTARPRPRAGEDSTEKGGQLDSTGAGAVAPDEGGSPAAGPAPSADPAGGRDGRTGDPKVLTAAGRRGGLAAYANSRSRRRAS